MNLKKNLRENQVIVVALPKKKYNTGIEDIVILADSVSSKICYVSLNEPYSTLAKTFEDSGLEVNDFFFVDCVSVSASKPRGFNVVFVSSPKALTELSLTISDVLNSNIEIIIFDSLSTLLAYVDANTAIKFVHAIVSKIRLSKKKCIFTALSEDSASDLMKDVNMFVDNIVSL